MITNDNIIATQKAIIYVHPSEHGTEAVTASSVAMISAPIFINYFTKKLLHGGIFDKEYRKTYQVSYLQYLLSQHHITI